MTQAPARRGAQAEFDTDELFRRLEDDTPSGARGRVFEAVTRVDPSELEAIVIRRQPVPPGTSARAIMRNLGKLLALRASDVAELLDVSEARVSRNDLVSITMLDRAYGISGVFAQVSLVLGPANARSWFTRPNAGLEGEAPYRLLGTSYGATRVESLVDALLHGAVV